MAASLINAGVDGKQFQLATVDVAKSDDGVLSDAPSFDRCSDEEFPTLLHFAARFGFGKLTWKLVECPGWHSAARVRNRQGLNVLQIAQNFGHSQVVNIIESAQEIHVIFHFNFALTFPHRFFTNFNDFTLFF